MQDSEVRILIWSVGIEALCHRCSCCSDDSSLHSQLTLLSTQSHDCQAGEGCLTARLQQEDAEEPERNPQQEDQPDSAEGEDTTDYDPDVDYVGSEPENETVVLDQSEVNLDAENASIEIPHDGTLSLRMMPQEKYMGILCVHRVQGSEIMTLRLQDTSYGQELAPKQPSCTSESKDQTVLIG